MTTRGVAHGRNNFSNEMHSIPEGYAFRRTGPMLYFKVLYIERDYQLIKKIDNIFEISDCV